MQVLPFSNPQCKSSSCTQCKTERESVALELLNYDFLTQAKFPPGLASAFPIYGGTFLAPLGDSLHMLLEQKVQAHGSPRLSRSSNLQSMSQLHFALIKRRSNLLITEKKTFSISELSRRTECLLIENGTNANISHRELARIIYSHT
jgi:hypothetical protein